MNDMASNNLGDKLAPCPFCKRKMLFYREEYTNRNGKTRIEQYYMHAPHDDPTERECILDELMMPFTIGAGDADEKTGDIGEYAQKWNEQLNYISK